MNPNQLAPDALRQKAFELTISPCATPDDMEFITELLQLNGEIQRDGRRKAIRQRKNESAAVQTCLERRAEVPDTEEVNPLDDDEKLRQVRIAVFGCAPE